MSEQLNLGALPVASSVAETDSLYVEIGSSLKRVSLSALTDAVRASIQIGGRNLIKETASFVVNTSSIKWLSGRCVLTTQELIANLPLTFSCRYRKTGTVERNFGIGASRKSDGSWYDHTIVTPANADSSGKITKTFYANTNADSFSLFVQGTAGVELFDIKLERGNMSTDWSPAPEDLLSQSGGVKCCTSLSCAILQKGGLRNERANEPYQRGAEGSNDGCDGVSGSLYRFQYQGAGNLSIAKGTNKKYAGLFIWLWNHGCDEHGELYCSADNHSRKYKSIGSPKDRPFYENCVRQWRLHSIAQIPVFLTLAGKEVAA